MATKKASTTPAKQTAKPAAEDAEASKPAAKAATKKAPAKSAEKPPAASKMAEAATTPKKKASHDEIARHAHSLWEKHGGRHGSHVDHWLHAEKELNG